jgi:nitrate/nitrite transport system ATP-binding protein
LMMIAGLNPITGGAIVLSDRTVKSAGPDRAVVFQSPNLYPWMTALDNVLLGVNNIFPHISKSERIELAKYYLTKMGLETAFNVKARNLSQGMQQRVGIARALSLKPNMILLDEPFGMLDSLTRSELQQVLLDIVEEENMTTIMVTHDVDEAVFLSDRVIMMTSGPYAKVGDELTISYPKPRNKLEFMDNPEFYNYKQHLLNFLNNH